MRKTFILLLLGLSTWLPAQPPQIERLPAGLKVAEMPVLAILPSQSGFLWFGTWFGLFRYDGYTLKEYLPEAQWDGKRVNAYKISCLFEDKKGILWIGLFSGGLFRFDPVTQQSTVWQFRQNDPATLSDNTVQCITEDPFGHIWVGTKDGLNRLDPQTGKVQRFFTLTGAPNGLQNHQIRSLCIGRDGALWIGTYNGIARAQLSADGAPVFQHFFLTPPPERTPPGVESPHDFIFTIREDSHTDGLFWIGTKGGLKRLDTRQPSFAGGLTHYRARPGGLSDNFVETILETAEGPNQILWIGTYNGLNRLEVATETFTTYLPPKGDLAGLNDQVVIALAADQAGLIWVGTNKGLNKINPTPKSFRNLNFGNSNENNLWALAGNSANGTEIWAGSAGGGLKHITVRGNDFVARSVSLAQLTGAPQANFIYDLYLDAEGWLWVATRGAGIIRYRTTGAAVWERFNIRSHQLSDNFVMSVHEDVFGRLWFGTWEGGLICYDRKSGRFRVFKNLPDDNVRLTDFPLVELLSSAAETGQNRMDLWIGTRGGGLLQVEVDSSGETLRLKNAFTSADSGPNHISNDNITAIRRGPDKQLWVTTEDGLNHWDTRSRRFTAWGVKDGLPDRIVQTVCFDGAGNAWISTGKGIAQLRFDDRSRLTQVRSFDKSDGLPTNFFHDGSGWMSPEGWLFMGSYEGLCFFSTAQIKEYQHAPNVVFSGLKIFNQPVGVGKNPAGKTVLNKDINFVEHITLPYSDNVFSIQFAALDFQEPGKNRYAWRLLGFHDEWVEVDAENREAHFTNLSEGEYTLEVKAANHDGVWSETPKQLKICIQPPFYRTYWAYLFYGLAIAGFAYWYRRMELARLELKSQVKMETLRREKTEEVERMKVHFFTHVSHELKTPLTLIISPLEDLLKGNLAQSETREVYEVMQRNANRLNHLINQILILRKTEEGLMKLSVGAYDLVEFLKDICIAFRELAHSHHVDFRFESTEETLPVWFDKEQLEKVFYNLLSNAFKFTEAGGHITVKLDLVDQQVRIVVEDDGKGIVEAELPRVFDLFYSGKADAALKQSSGTGIGLALSKSIVDLHGGIIQAESAGEGCGSRFTVSLLLGNDHFNPDNLAAAPAKQLLPAVPAQHEPANGKEHFTPEKENPLILVVDDHEDIRAYIRLRLQAHYTVQEAADGREAWEKTHQLVPDLVISDILMPEWDGLQLCRQIKNDPMTSHIPVILLTAKGNTSTQIDGLEAGADSYIAKPFDPELLLARVRNLLQAQERLQKHFRHGAPMTLKELDISHLDQQFLEKCIECIERHVADPEYSVEHLGKALFMSRMQLYRKIKALTGESPNHFIRNIRLSRAAQLLEKGFSVAEVTYQVGFQDLKYFRESFRKQFGVNPSEYGAKRKG